MSLIWDAFLVTLGVALALGLLVALKFAVSVVLIAMDIAERKRRDQELESRKAKP